MADIERATSKYGIKFCTNRKYQLLLIYIFDRF